GTAIVYLFTDTGPRTLVFEVRPRPPRKGGQVSGWGGHPRRQRGNTSYDAGVGYSRTGREAETLVTTHRVGLHQDVGTMDVDGHLAVAVGTTTPLGVTSARLAARWGRWSLSAGDDAVLLASRLSRPRTRGVRVEWRDEGHHRAAGAVIGSVVPWSCCAYIDQEQPLIVTTYGSTRVGEDTRVGASAGVTRDPRLARTLAHARVHLERTSSDTWASMEGVFSGEGGGAFAQLRVGGQGPFSFDGTMEGVSRGFYNPSTGFLYGDRVMAYLHPSVRAREWLHVSATARGLYGDSENSRARATAIAGGAVHLTPGPWGLSAGYQRENNWVLEDVEPLPGSHLLDLAASIRSGHAWVHAGAQTQLEDAGEYTTRLHGTQRWNPIPPWTFGLAEQWTFGTAVPSATLRVHADLSRRVRTLEMQASAGGQVAFEPGGTVVLPSAHLGMRWAPHTSHRFGLWTSYLARPESQSHLQVFAQYSYDGWRGRPGSRAVGLQGAIRGVVYDDLDAGGVRDPGEPGLGGGPVRLDGRDQVTDEAGGYRFGWVSNGPHEVSIDRNGWRSIDGTVHQVEVRSLSTAETDFALSSAGRVLARVFLDRDHDGVFTSTDRIIPTTGVALVSVAEGDVVARGGSPGGVVDFPGVAPGAYVVALDPAGLPEGYFPSDSGQAYAQVTKGAIVNVHLPVDALRTIGGRVFLDANRNGVRDTGDTPAPHTLVSLDDGQQRRTVLAGNFLFRRLSSGLYQVSVPGAYASEKIDLSNGPSEELSLEILV
ncbi:MAG: hypothetical protein JRI25_24320, partial [Deltaproteobacteria bacterium]|nr:hypothetical protein [Deltaproteobacteria bacterium]